ncbi:MAG: nitrilase-related carbon-nitrogen hydrolase [Sphingomonadales bacterium]
MSIAPYMAVGLVPLVRGVHARSEIAVNLDHLEELFGFGCQMSGLDLPVKLVAIPEGALQGFADEAEDLDHVEYAADIAIDIPGPETARIGMWARRFGVYVMAQAKARHPDFPERFFNVGFIIDPQGEIILRHYKLTPLYPIEHSLSPHDVFDIWIERYGRTLDAFWPVADTPIGRLGVMMANEGSYPENARALALNGCEIAYRTAFPIAGTGAGMAEIQNRARALDNTMYVLAPNNAAYYPSVASPSPIDAFGGRSMIIDHRGDVVGRLDHGGIATVVSGIIDIGALRHQRLNSPWTNWAKDLRTELYQIVYELPIYPKNLYAQRRPFNHHDYRDQVTLAQIELMKARGIWKP